MKAIFCVKKCIYDEEEKTKASMWRREIESG
jgi:hypothetical protein